MFYDEGEIYTMYLCKQFLVSTLTINSLIFISFQKVKKWPSTRLAQDILLYYVRPGWAFAHFHTCYLHIGT